MSELTEMTETYQKLQKQHDDTLQMFATLIHGDPVLRLLNETVVGIQAEMDDVEDHIRMLEHHARKHGEAP